MKPRRNAAVLGSILNKMPRTKEFKELDWQMAKRKERRQALTVPFVYRMYRMKRKRLDLARYVSTRPAGPLLCGCSSCFML